MLGGSPLILGLTVTWVTPLWVLSAGAALGVAVLAALYGILFLISRPAADVAVTTVREGVLAPIAYLVLFLTAFVLVGVLVVPEIPYRSIISSVSRIASVGPKEIEIEVPPTTHDFELTALEGPQPELKRFTIEADQPLQITTNIPQGLIQTLSLRLAPGSPFNWDRQVNIDPERSKASGPPDPFLKWTATNTGDEPAKLRAQVITDIEFPEVYVVPGTALFLVGLVLAYLALRLLMPKVAAIALTTARESMSQPLFYVALAVGAVALVTFIFIPYNTFGEDVKMLKDSGLTLIMVLSMIVAVWSASVSVSEEVEGRTALTVLSKPVRRRQFILGKFLGILGPVVVLFVLLGFLFLVTVSVKVVYDSREMSKMEPSWQICFTEMIRIVPGLALAFMETVVLSSISVAMSTRLPMLANLLVCASIYVLGHLVPMLVNSSVGKFEIVRFVGQFIATVLPVLDVFNIQAAVAAGAVVPWDYLGMAFVYCLLYTTVAMLLGLLMFEDRDLA